MKRGRPAMRNDFRESILGVLGGYEYPVTVTTVKKLLDARRTHPCGWDTVRKYLNELAEERLVLRGQIPHTEHETVGGEILDVDPFSPIQHVAHARDHPA